MLHLAFTFDYSRIAIFAALGSLLAGCGKPGTPAAASAPVVFVTRPILREIIEWDEYIGRLESPESVEVRARVNGYLDKVHFKEGAEIKKGDLLFTIDQRPFQAEFERADAEFQRASSLADLAKNDADRAKRLINTKVIAEEDYDNKSKSYNAALAAARSAKAAADLARLDLEFSEIRAPIDGRIGRALVTAGNLISSGPGGAGGTLLTTIVSLDPLYLYGDADERAILKYIRLSRAGARDSVRDKQIPVEMQLADETGFPRKGHMDFLDNRVDPATGTVLARGVFRNEDHRLGPGFFARIRIPGSGKYMAVLIPDRALGADQAQKFVYVVDALKKVEFRPVTVGGMSDGLRIVNSGLQPEDQIIVEGQMLVRPGATVDARPTEKAP